MKPIKTGEKEMKMTAMVVLAMVIGLVFSVNSFAKDVELKTKIEKATVQIDKNGNEYVRLIITENRVLNGIKYESSVPVMAFGETVPAAKALKTGDVLHCIADLRDFQGRPSYTLKAIVK